MSEGFNPFAGVADQFNKGQALGMDYAKTAVELDLKKSMLQQKQQELAAQKQQRDFEAGKWFMDQVQTIAAKPGGKYKNELITSFQKGLTTMGYANNDALKALLVDENYANEVGQAISSYGLMSPEQKQEWLPKMVGFIQSGDPAAMLQQFNSQAADLGKMREQEALKAKAESVKSKTEKPVKDLGSAIEVRKSIQTDKIFDEYSSIRSHFNALEDAVKKPGPFKDLDAMYSFMKMLDPASVVRESEGKLFIQTGSAFQGIANSLQKMYDGKSLDDKQRNQLFSIAGNKLKQYKDRYENFSSGIVDEAVKTGLKKEAVDPGFKMVQEDNARLKKYEVLAQKEDERRKKGIEEKTKTGSINYSPKTVALIQRMKAKGFDRKKIEAMTGIPIPQDLAVELKLD